MTNDCVNFKCGVSSMVRGLVLGSEVGLLQVPV